MKLKGCNHSFNLSPWFPDWLWDKEYIVKTGKLYQVWLSTQDLVGFTELQSLGDCLCVCFLFYPCVRLVDISREEVVCTDFGAFQKGVGLDSSGNRAAHHSIIIPLPCFLFFTI